MRRGTKAEATCLGWLILIGGCIWAFQNHAIAASGLVVLLAGLLFRKSALERKALLGHSLEELDTLSGSEFEDWIAATLEADGIATENIQLSGDFGVDVIASIGGKRVGIQAKRYAQNVGNDAVQQVLGGCDVHGCEVAAVVTQAQFTKAARTQAGHARIPIALIGRKKLPRMAKILRELVS